MAYINRIELKLIREKIPSYTPKRFPHKITSPEDVYKVFSWLSAEVQENLYVLCLDAKNQIVGLYHASKGSGTGTIVNSGDVFRPALLTNTVSIILVHNHPSGDTEPSEDDVKITQRIKKAGDVLDIRVLDHVIIGNKQFRSIICDVQ